ncbi:MAG: nucleotidyltransferase domain-containing protein, partial [Steroidobacteraceae bacterium]
LQRDARVLAVFLDGSLADGTADDYSDIDWVVVTEHREPVASLCQGYLAQCAELVSWQRAHGPRFAFNGITADWIRCDVALLTPQEIRTRARASLHVLWDRARVAETLSTVAGTDHGVGAELEPLIDRFLRGLGLLPVIVGRGEYRLGVSSAERLRGLLAELLLEVDAAPDRGAALRLDPFLTDESRKVLDAIPIAAPARESVIVAHLACARSFLPRARALAEARRIAWPSRFEAATIRVLREELGIDLPASA